MHITKVKDIMTSHPILISPDASLQEAASIMQRNDCGALPVGKNDKLEGIITDRDIIIRAISKGKNSSKENVRNHMTAKVHCCRENDTLQDAADIMHKYQVSRLVVKSAIGNVSGIISFGGILRKDASSSEVAEVVAHATGTKYR